MLDYPLKPSTISSHVIFICCFFCAMYHNELTNIKLARIYSNTCVCDVRFTIFPHETSCLGTKQTNHDLCRLLRTFIGLLFISPLQQSREASVMSWSQRHSRPPGGWNMYAWCATMFQGRDRRSVPLWGGFQWQQLASEESTNHKNDHILDKETDGETT